MFVYMCTLCCIYSTCTSNWIIMLRTYKYVKAWHDRMVTICWRIIGIITTFHIGFNNITSEQFVSLLWCVSTHIHQSVSSPWTNTCACPQEEPHLHILVESTPHPKARWWGSEQGGVVHPTADYEDSRNQNAILHCECEDMTMQHHKKLSTACCGTTRSYEDWLTQDHY